MEEIRYSMAYSFCYSRRPNTSALTKFTKEQEVDKVVARERLARLIKLQSKHCLEFNTKFVTHKLPVIIEGTYHNKEGAMRGRTVHNVLVEVIGDRLKVGDEVEVLIDHASPHGLKGRQCGSTV